MGPLCSCGGHLQSIPDRLLTQGRSCSFDMNFVLCITRPVSSLQKHFVHNEGRWQTVKVSSVLY